MTLGRQDLMDCDYEQGSESEVKSLQKLSVETFPVLLEQKNRHREPTPRAFPQPSPAPQRATKSPASSMVVYQDGILQRSYHARVDSVSNTVGGSFPYRMIGYMQLLSNIMGVAMLAYLMYLFYHAVKNDIDVGISQSLQALRDEISFCQKEFENYKCLPISERPVELHAKCEMLNRCLMQDPNSIPIGKISARSISDIINNLVEPLSTKTLVFCSVLVASIFILPNIASILALVRGTHIQPQAHFPSSASRPEFSTRARTDQGYHHRARSFDYYDQSSH